MVFRFFTVLTLSLGLLSGFRADAQTAKEHQLLKNLGSYYFLGRQPAVEALANVKASWLANTLPAYLEDDGLQAFPDYERYQARISAATVLGLTALPVEGALQSRLGHQDAEVRDVAALALMIRGNPGPSPNPVHALQAAALMDPETRRAQALRMLHWITDQEQDPLFNGESGLKASAFMHLHRLHEKEPEERRRIEELLLRERPNQRFLLEHEHYFGDTHPEIHLHRAKAEEEADRFLPIYAAIIHDYPESYRGEPDSCAFGKYALGAVWHIMERTLDRDRAIAALRKAGEANLPADVRGHAYLTIADIHIAAKQYDQAVSVLKYLLKRENASLVEGLAAPDDLGDGEKYVHERLWDIPRAGDSPAPPEPVRPDGKVKTSDPLTFTWKPVDDAFLYAVYVSRKPYGEANLVYTNRGIPGTETSAVFETTSEWYEELGPGAYRWNTRAFVGSRPTGYSSPVYFEIVR